MKGILRSLYGAGLMAMSATLSAENGGPPAPPADQSLTQTLVMIAIALAFFYLILWRPEQKRRREMEDQRGALKKGDRVTAMGIIGTVSRVNEDTVILKMVDGAKIEFIKSAISDVLSEESGGEKDAGESGQSKRIPMPK